VSMPARGNGWERSRPLRATLMSLIK
jgi:hypothetical protein